LIFAPSEELSNKDFGSGIWTVDPTPTHDDVSVFSMFHDLLTTCVAYVSSHQE
jgi:hypothetical protein